MLAPIQSYKGRSQEFEVDLRDCKYLGEGHNGIVYLMPDGKVIKIFKEKKCCKMEFMILKSAAGSDIFPRVYDYGENYIIRDFVKGTCAKDYIKEKGLSTNLALNLLSMIDEFSRLRFTKLDIRCRDIYVQEDESIIVIDPKSSYTRNVTFPRHLAKGLKKLDAIVIFMDVVKTERPELYEEWVPKMINAGVF